MKEEVGCSLLFHFHGIVVAMNNIFPFLKGGNVYLDSSASSLTPEPVLIKMMEFYHDYRANVGHARKGC